jgi:hypothetical protein
MKKVLHLDNKTLTNLVESKTKPWGQVCHTALAMHEFHHLVEQGQKLARIASDYTKKKHVKRQTNVQYYKKITPFRTWWYHRRGHSFLLQENTNSLCISFHWKDRSSVTTPAVLRSHQWTKKGYKCTRATGMQFGSYAYACGKINQS